MIFDTGSSWTWVSSNLCQDCPGDEAFDITTSSSFSSQRKSADLGYGSGYCSGYISTDLVCVTESECSESFNFVLVTSQDGLETLDSDGIVGLGPTKDPETSLFIDRMKSSGAIQSAVFSFAIDPSGQSSYMTLGGYDTYRFATSELNWHPIDVSTEFW